MLWVQHGIACKNGWIHRNLLIGLVASNPRLKTIIQELNIFPMLLVSIEFVCFSFRFNLLNRHRQFGDARCKNDFALLRFDYLHKKFQLGPVLGNWIDQIGGVG